MLTHYENLMMPLLGLGAGKTLFSLYWDWELGWRKFTGTGIVRKGLTGTGIIQKGATGTGIQTPRHPLVVLYIDKFRIYWRRIVTE